MGDTARSDVTTTSGGIQDEKDEMQIQFPAKDDYTTESDDETPREPPQKESEETLIKNSSNSDTTAIDAPSFMSDSGPTTQSAQSTPRRRHNRQTLFEEPKPLTSQEIFSVNGQRGVNLPRHQDNVTCFPSGCMGIKDDEDQIKEVSPRAEEPPVVAKHSVLTQEEQKEILQKPETAPKKDLHLHTIARNPLTGEGYEDKDFVNLNGNPVLGHGYVERKKSKQSKIPPGGHSQGLW